MPSAKTINLKVLAQTDAFAKKLAELPGMTEKEAKKAGKKLAKQFEKAEKAAAKNALNTAKQWDKAFSQLQIGGTRFGSVISALKQPQALLVAGIAGVAAAGFKAAEAMSTYTDGIVNLAAITGMSVEATAGLEFAAKGAGIELQTLKGGLQALNQKAGDAVTTGGEAARIFQRLGVQVKDSGGQVKSMEVLLSEVVDSLASMENATLSASLAQKLMGGEGVLLTAALADGSGALTEWTERVREAGIVSEATQIASKRMDAAQAELAFSARAASQTLGREFAPAASGSKKVLAGLLDVVNKSAQGYAQLGQRIALLNEDYAEAIRVEEEMIATGELLRAKNLEIAGSMETVSDAALALRDSLTDSLVKAGQRGADMMAQARDRAAGLAEETVGLNQRLRENQRAIRARRDAMREAGETSEEEASALRDLHLLLDANARIEADLATQRRRSAEAAKLRAERAREQAAADRKAAAAARALAGAQASWNDQILRATDGAASADLVKRLQEIGAAQMQGAINAEQATMLVTAANAQYEESIVSANTAARAAHHERIDQLSEEAQATKLLQQERLAAVLESSGAITGALKSAAGDDFRAQQALAVSEVLMRSAVGVVNILSGAGGPIVKGAQLAALAAATAVSTAEIANQQPPKMHTGGIVPDERPARLLTGEGVLSRQGVAALGGAGAVHAANAGRPGAAPQVIQMVYKHRVLDTVIKDQLKSDSSLRRAINSGTRLGHR